MLAAMAAGSQFGRFRHSILHVRLVRLVRLVGDRSNLQRAGAAEFFLLVARSGNASETAVIGQDVTGPLL